VSEADVIIFLGFAYHPMNLLLLTPKGGTITNRLTCYGTATGMSNSDCDVVRTDLEPLKQTRGMDTSVSNSYDCAGLFREFRRVWFDKLNGQI